MRELEKPLFYLQGTAAAAEDVEGAAPPDGAGEGEEAPAGDMETD